MEIRCVCLKGGTATFPDMLILVAVGIPTKEENVGREK